MKKLSILFPIIFALNAGPQAEGNPEDCVECAVVTDLDPVLYPAPFPVWSELIDMIALIETHGLEIKDMDYRIGNAFTIVTNNNIVKRYTSIPYNLARIDALGSGLAVNCTEYNASNRWFVQWGDNDFAIEGYVLLEAELNSIKAQNKKVKFISIADGGEAFVIILDDATLVHQGLNAPVLAAINANASALKSMSFNEKGDLAIIKNDGSLVLLTPSFNDNDNRFIAKIQSDFYQGDPSAEAEFLHLGNDDHLLFYGRNASGPVLFAKGPREEVKDIVITQDGGSRAEITAFMSSDYKYQLQDSPSLSANSWRKIGPEVAGDNSYKLFSSAIESGAKFYRFVITY